MLVRLLRILISGLGLTHCRGGGILYDLMPHSLKQPACPGLTHGMWHLPGTGRVCCVGMKQGGRTGKACGGIGPCEGEEMLWEELDLTEEVKSDRAEFHGL